MNERRTPDVGLEHRKRSVSADVLPLAACCLLLSAGCGYTLGHTFPAEVRSVEVPVFEARSFRRDIEFRLTEAIQDEIKRRTPFRLAKGPDADTRLSGKIVQFNKRARGLSGTDEARTAQLTLAVEMTWEDLRTGQLLAQQQIPVQPDIVQLLSHANFSPEVGQSRTTATQQAVDRLARQIVNMMEAPW